MGSVCKILCIVLASMAIDMMSSSIASACTLRDVFKCNDPLESMTPEEDTDREIVCGKLSEATECFTSLFEQCPAEVQDNIEMAMAEFNYLQQSCMVDTGSCSYFDLNSCTAPLRHHHEEEEGETEALIDLDVLCPLTLTAIDCLTQEMETCPLFMKFQFKLAEEELETYKVACEYHMSNPNPDPSMCSLQEIFQCGMPLETLSEEEYDNMLILCPKLIESVECTVAEMQTCPQDLKSELRRTMMVMERQSKYCRLMMNRTSTSGDVWGNNNAGGGGDSGKGTSNVYPGAAMPLDQGANADGTNAAPAPGGEFGDGGPPGTNPAAAPSGELGDTGGCTQMTMVVCMASLQTMSAADKRNLDVVCPATRNAISCLTTQKPTCPEMLQPMFEMALGGLARGEKLCNDHWAAGASGLKLNFLILLVTVTATSAVLRHIR